MKKEIAQAVADLLEGHQILGGCLDCQAFQVITQTEDTIALNVYHDEECPTYRGVIR